jgi:hypothetical protein
MARQMTRKKSRLTKQCRFLNDLTEMGITEMKGINKVGI